MRQLYTFNSLHLSPLFVTTLDRSYSKQRQVYCYDIQEFGIPSFLGEIENSKLNYVYILLLFLIYILYDKLSFPVNRYTLRE